MLRTRFYVSRKPLMAWHVWGTEANLLRQNGPNARWYAPRAKFGPVGHDWETNSSLEPLFVHRGLIFWNVMAWTLLQKSFFIFARSYRFSLCWKWHLIVKLSHSEIARRHSGANIGERGYEFVFNPKAEYSQGFHERWKSRTPVPDIRFESGPPLRYSTRGTDMTLWL